MACGPESDGARRTKATLVSSSRSGDENICNNVIGYFEGDDGTFKTVRSEPNETAASLGKILGPVRVEDQGSIDYVAASFRVISAKGGWLHITHAIDDPDRTGQKARRMFAGTGWIDGKEVTVGVQSSKAFASPDNASQLLLDGGHDFLDQNIVATEECRGKWVKLRWKVDKRLNWKINRDLNKDVTIEGWVSDICNIAETTCS
jgi:hypothetical protein